MRKLRERLFKSAICLVAAVVVMPTMADDTAFALDQERLSLNLVLPDAAGAFPTNANPYWENVSRAEFTNVLERISKMTRLKDLSLNVHAESKVPLDLSFLSSQTNMTELSLGGNLHICSFRKIVHLPLERLDGCYYSDSSVSLADEDSLGMSNCVSDKRYESVIGLGRPFHGFTTVKLIGCGEVERIGDETYDGPVDSLEFLREDDGVVFDFPSEKKWAMEIAAEMERVYGATFCWDDNDETATFLVVKGKSDAFDFAIASCAGSSETHCGTGDEVSITRREYRSRQFYVSRRLREFRPSFKDIEATNPDHRRQFRIYSVRAADVEGCKNRNVVWRHDILVKGAEFPLDDSLSISIYAKGRDAKKGEVQSEPCILSRSDTELRIAWPEEYAGEEFSQGRMDIVLSNVVDPTDIPDGIKHREIRAFISKPE